MEERNITLSLEKAREWYYDGGVDLKEIALQAFSEEELKTKSWENIKTFEDACDELDINPKVELDILNNIIFGKQFIALYKVNIIRQALNKDYKPSLVHGTVYYPWVRFYKSYDDAKSAVRNNDWKLCGKVEIEGTSCYLVGGDASGCDYGLGFFYFGFGGVDADLGLLCCESREIAQHMSKYFAKEIFDAIYIDTCKYKIYNE
jgi:hypothetical protein